MSDLTRRICGYSTWVVLATIILAAGLRLDQADLSVPLGYHGDTLLILPLVKSTVETGTHWHNDRLGAPGIQELHDFPIVDHLHFAILWLMGQVLPSYVWCFNLYHLASYPLAVLMTMIVLRSFGISFSAAGLAGMLYAFLPYHYIRGYGHYFLSAYWTVPLMLWPALRLLWGLGLFDRRWTAVGTVLIAIMTSCAGAYYAFFGCATLGFAGLFSWIAYRNWRLFASACVTIAVIVAGGVVNHLPAIRFQQEYGPNTEVTQRQPEEAETYGLKMAQMLLPVGDHHWRVFRNLRQKYDSDHRDLQNENETATLGLIGSVTFVLLLASVLLRRGPTVTECSSLALFPIASITLFLFLLGTVGGVGSLFNFLITPEVRSLNRISIVLAFFVFTALAIGFDRIAAAYKRFAPERGRFAANLPLAALALALFGIWDQTHRGWFRSHREHYDQISDAWQRDRVFFQEATTGPVFCLPMIPYPETFKVGKLDGYDHVRGYLHGRPDVAWSFGAVKGREADIWQREVSLLPIDDMLDRLVFRGFRYVFLDLRGYSAADAEPWREMLKGLPPGIAQSTAVGEYLIDLSERRTALTLRLGQAEFDRRCDAEKNRVTVLWLKGFVSFQPPGQEDQHRWCGRRGTAVIVNPSSATRTFDVNMVLRSSPGEHGQLNIDGGDVWSESMQLTDASPLIARSLVVPPGRHTIRFHFTPMRDHVPKDSRDNVFFIAFFTMKESADSR